MSNKIVYDRDGNAYEVSAHEADHMLASGAYYEDEAHVIAVTTAVVDDSLPCGMMAVFDISTGERLVRRAVDAAELVRTGHYSLCPVGVEMEALESPESLVTLSPEVTDPALPSAPDKSAALVELSMDNSKEDIAATLADHGVTYRNNMSKADLLELWNDYLDEHNQ